MNTSIADTPVATQLFLTCASLDFERRAVIIAMDKTAAGCFRAKLLFCMQHQSRADLCIEDSGKVLLGCQLILKESSAVYLIDKTANTESLKMASIISI